MIRNKSLSGIQTPVIRINFTTLTNNDIFVEPMIDNSQEETDTIIKYLKALSKIRQRTNTTTTFEYQAIQSGKS